MRHSSQLSTYRLLRTFAKFDIEVGAAAVKAAAQLAPTGTGERWARFLRHLNVELGFVRTKDALRYALQDELREAFNEHLPPGMSRYEWHEWVDFLPHLKIGHLVPFAQMLPKAYAHMLAVMRQQQAQSFLQSAFLCTFPPNCLRLIANSCSPPSLV